MSVRTLLRHIERQYPDYSVSECVFHYSQKKGCFTLLNNFNEERFHCLYTDHAPLWRSYTLTGSCDLPDAHHDLLLLHRALGDSYVLPFASHFRESSGVTVALFRQSADLYSPVVIDRATFKRMAYAMLVVFVAVCFRLGGATPNLKQFSFAYTREHAVLCDIGAANAAKKEVIAGKERFDRKKWVKFLCKKKTVSLIGYLKIYFPRYFQKKKAGRRCILHEDEHGFDDETHRFFCHDMFLIDALKNFSDWMPDETIREVLIPRWIALTETPP